jgi:hypothetical protein
MVMPKRSQILFLPRFRKCKAPTTATSLINADVWRLENLTFSRYMGISLFVEVRSNPQDVKPEKLFRNRLFTRLY